MAIGSRDVGWCLKATWAVALFGLFIGLQPLAAEEKPAEGDAAAETADPKVEEKAEEPAKPESVDLLTSLGSVFKPYGFVQLDAAWSDSRFALDSQLAGYVRSEDEDAPRPAVGAPKDESEFTMYTRLARLGMDLNFGTVSELGDALIKGKVEVDFYGGGTDSRNLLRMRHAYLTMSWTNLEILAGQTSDLISPRFPAINYDLIMWGAGNLGDRRPQARVTGKFSFGKATLTMAGMFGATGAVDNQDLDGNGVKDGQQAGLPTLQARIGFDYKLWEKGSALGFAIWAHWALEDVDNFGLGTRDENTFASWAIGFDTYIPVWEDLVWIHGEGWVGENLTDVRGGIFQGVNADGEEIKAFGGWIELGVKITSWWKAHVGYATDDPESRDLPATGRVVNKIFYMKTDWAFGPVYFALEYSYWETEYKGFGAGRANRVKGYVGYKF